MVMLDNVYSVSVSIDMKVSVGQCLGNFEVTAVLGKGGMGEVWRATDDKLGREVALKVLPEDFAEDPDRHSRFEREAKVLGSLNHPNIATLFGLEHFDGAHVLVMELVEGEGLDQLIARGPIPLDDVISIALQIADGLEAAHEAGIVHRDLKPANIRVRTDGTVKVLDFGLAKSWETNAGDSSLSISPTVTRHATVEGVILGTAAYMSPEQARGKKVDRRADIWAFGVVLWEMLTGNKLFEGETVSDLLAAVLTRDPDMQELPKNTPLSIKRLLNRCLDRDSKNRLQWIGDARLELTEEPEAGTESEISKPESARFQLLPWAVAALFAVIAIATTLTVFEDSSSNARVVRFSIHSPEGSEFHLEGLGPGPVELSPDGSRIAFTLRDQTGRVSLCVRRIDSVDINCLGGTDAAQYPFWSPDGQEIGFFTRTGTALKIIPVEGGAIRTLASSRNGKGATWNSNGDIVYTPDSNTPLFTVSAEGGEPEQLTTFDESRGDNSHRHPWFLPDGQRFLYVARSVHGSDANTIMVGSLDGKTDKELMRSPGAVQFAGEHLLFLRGTTLMARPFDTEKLTFSGNETQLADDVMIVGGAARGVFSATGEVLTFQQGEYEGRRDLVWLDRAGNRLGVLGDSGSYFSLAVSPDGTRVAVPVTNEAIGTHDIWIYDVDRNLRSRVTFDDGEEYFPTWSPDGRDLYYSSNANGPLAIFRLTPGESDDPELVIGGEKALYPSSVSPDGKRLLLASQSKDFGKDVMLIELSGDRQLEVFRSTQFVEEHATFSPDGRWVAYTSNESGEFEIYVTSSSGTGKHWQLSTEGGVWPRWIPDTGEVLYQDAAGQFVVVPVRTNGQTIEIGKPEVLFGGYMGTRLFQLYDPVPDGSRILFRALSNQNPPDPPTVVVNWLSEVVSQ